MQKIVECPICFGKGLHIELKNGYRVVASGRRISEYPLVAVCRICKRKIKYDVAKEDK